MEAPGPGVGQKPGVGCGAPGLGQGRGPVWVWAGGRQPGGAQGRPLARRGAGACRFPTRLLPPVSELSPAGGRAGAPHLPAAGVGKVRAAGARVPPGFLCPMPTRASA